MTDQTTRITGASDDLIELDGAIYDEIGTPFNDPTTDITFDNGAKVRVIYDDEGVWRITDASPEPGLVTIVRCEDRPGYTGPDGSVYSDEATVTGATNYTYSTPESSRND